MNNHLVNNSQVNNLQVNNSQVNKLTDDSVDYNELINSNNGLMTKIWGPGLWEGVHSISFGYPVNPTEEDKRNYKQFFTLMGDVLPCGFCRDSYKKFISTGSTKLTDDVMQSRHTLTKWLFLIHEEVNKKLGVNYGVSYKDVVKRYNSFRAGCGKKNKDANNKGCILPFNDKAQSYKIANNKDCCFIPIDLAKQFVKYAKIRGIPDKEFYFLKNYENIKEKRSDVNCDQWCVRNKECSEIIKNMRINNTTSLENEGRWTGLPTYDELRLIMRLTSNLNIKELMDTVDKLPNNYKKNKRKVYKLVKDES